MKPQSHEEIKKEFNELWNSHDGDHFYKDEFWDFIKSKLSQRDADKGGGCCLKCLPYHPDYKSCINLNCDCHSPKPQANVGNSWEDELRKFLIDEEFEVRENKANVVWKVRPYPPRDFISNLISTTSAQKLEGLERSVEGLRVKWEWDTMKDFQGEAFRNCHTCGWLENNPESSHVCETKNDCLTAVLDIIRKQK